MDGLAFVFSGQGAQYPGMGRALYEQNSAAKAVFDTLEGLRPGTLRQCFEADAQELTLTANTQPCMFAVELAAAKALEAAGVQASALAGFSLGEIAALTYSGAVDLQTGFELVCRRGTLMQQAAEQTSAGMMAVVKLDDDTVEYLCCQFPQVYPVNYNCPGQVAVAGVKDELTAFAAAVKQAGGRAIPLKVQGAFHSPFMQAAADGFAAVLAGTQLSAPQLPLYSDVTALPYEGELQTLLAKQICSPVRWRRIVENMKAAGIDTMVELGPGQTLCGLIGKTDPSIRTLHVEDCESLDNTVQEVLSC